MRRLATSLLLAVVAAGNVRAQSNPLSQSLRDMYDPIKKYLTQTAALVPDNQYGFKPTPSVRSFAQLIGHVADAQYAFCSTAKKEKSPQKASFEKTLTTKADLQKALADSFAYCDAVYTSMTDAQLGAAVDAFGEKHNVMWALAFNVAHDNEHYGNLVTYMRIKGMVPPSSAPATGM